MKIRLEEKTDYKEVEYLIREAFWNVYRPGCYEHYIVHNLRHDISFIRGLDYVIEEDNKIIGHITYSSNDILNDGKKVCDVITLGPLSILPEYQKQGYGTKLIEFTLKKAKSMDIPYIFVIGDENYYQRFGFESASQYNIKFKDIEDPTPFFMIKIFDKNKIKELKGVYLENRIFKVDEKELELFDKRFPPKIKEKREGQLTF